MEIPAHQHRIQPWRQNMRGGTREDRTLSELEVSLPPHIKDLAIAVPSDLGAVLDDALREIAAVDEVHGGHLGSLSTLLLRAESVASSKIEHVEASLDDYARALHGMKSNASATSMVSSTTALTDLIDSVGVGGPIGMENICRAHRVLMADDSSERAYAGRMRDMQNWIGGSGHSPRGALYVPPPPSTLADYMDDLLEFSNRGDMGVLVQAALAHAQFESIHPFTDGNGRIGRALVNTILRRRGVTRRVVVPIASGLVARRQNYFDALGAYRKGDPRPIIESFASAAALAALESRTTAQRLAQMPEEWRESVGRIRKGSALARLLVDLLDHPVFSAEEAANRIGGATSSVYSAIERLQASGVIRPLTHRVRNQVWVASSLADELDDLGVRIAAKANQT